MYSTEELIREGYQNIMLKGDSIGVITEDYLKQVSLLLKDPITRFPQAGKKQLEYMKALSVYLESLMRPPFRHMSVGEIGNTLGLKLREEAFWEYYHSCVCIPFKERTTGAGVDCAPLFEQLYLPISAISEKGLKDLIGPCIDPVFDFLLLVFGYSPIIYNFRSFKDTGLETLYSNDGLVNLGFAKPKNYVNTFIRFFIDGDADYDAVYNPKAYFGAIPVSEARIIDYCKLQGIPDNYIHKLIGMMKCSHRFAAIEEEGETRYYLKVQYLNNIYAMVVHILNSAGHPLHKEELANRINSLHKQYPSLVQEVSLESFVLRRKPVICASGKQGNWSLRTWEKLEEGIPRSDTTQVYSLIRDYVSSQYAETGQPVSLDSIRAHITGLGFNYPPRSLQTYVTNSGCKSVRNGNYLPEDSVEEGDTRYWLKKFYLIQQIAAYCILEKKRSCTRGEIVEYIKDETDHPISKRTLDIAIKNRPDVFVLIGKRANQRINLNDSVRTRKDVLVSFPKPEKKKQDYKKTLQEELVNYLMQHGEEKQSTLTTLFGKMIPSHIKSKDSIIRRELSDTSVFQKDLMGNKDTRVTLNPIYLKQIQLSRHVYDSSTGAPTGRASNFSWEGLKEGIIRELVGKNEVTSTLTQTIDTLFLILRWGKDQITINDTFKDIAEDLFTYFSEQTDNKFRRALCKDLLLSMEAYLRAFYKVKYGLELQEEGFGPLRYRFMAEGLLPDKKRQYLNPDEMKVFRLAERINNDRNGDPAHPGEFKSLAENQINRCIHDCLELMVYLAEEL